MSRETPSILIVDDDAETRTMYRVGLEAVGLHALEADTASGALEIARAEHPEVLVADLLLAGASGADLCRAIRGDPSLRSTRVVIVTGISADGAHAMLRDVSADAVLTKPINFDQFTAICGGMARAAASRHG